MRAAHSNPCSGIRRYKEKKRERFLSAEEIGRLGKTLGEAARTRTENAGVIAAIRLLIFTGMRLGEVRHLQWRHIQADRAALRLEESKTGPKTIHLNAPALEIINHIKQTPDAPWVFPGERGDGPISVTRIESAWRRLRKEPGSPTVGCTIFAIPLPASAPAVGCPCRSSALCSATLSQRRRRATRTLPQIPLQQAADMIGPKDRRRHGWPIRESGTDRQKSAGSPWLGLAPEKRGSPMLRLPQ